MRNLEINLKKCSATQKVAILKFVADHFKPDKAPSEEMKQEWAKRQLEAEKRGLVNDDPNWKPSPAMEAAWDKRAKEDRKRMHACITA